MAARFQSGGVGASRARCPLVGAALEKRAPRQAACLRHLLRVLTCSTGVDARFCAWMRLEALQEGLQRCLR